MNPDSSKNISITFGYTQVVFIGELEFILILN
jgi:hypothetical protein